MRRFIATVTYPIAGETAERPLLAVWIALALTFVIPLLPLLPVIGYLTRLLAASERGAELPPLLDHPTTLLRQSLGGSLLCLPFLVLPIAGLLVTVYGAVSMGGDTGDVPALRFLAGSTAVLFLGLLGFYLLPIALTIYGQNGSLRSAIALAALRRVASHGAYFAGWTAGCVVLSLAGALGMVLLDVHRIGPLLAAFPLAYGLLVTAHIWGRAISRTR
jgi:hypothetical protein